MNIVIFGVLLALHVFAAWAAGEIAMRQVYGKGWRKDRRYNRK